LTHRKILVVEDEYFLADDLANALANLGAEVLGPVPTEDKALALIEAGPVDAAVLDINLRGRSAFAVADLLRERGIPFVFATGYDEGSVPAVYRNVPRWEKPFDPHALAKALPEIVQAS
jgi:CheY-like chemotaxis protein